jgi:hypothetical protein
MTNN